MRVVYNNFPVFNANGSQAGVLDGEYEAIQSTGQQFGWYALHRVNADGSLSERAEANFNMVGLV